MQGTAQAQQSTILSVGGSKKLFVILFLAPGKAVWQTDPNQLIESIKKAMPDTIVVQLTIDQSIHIDESYT